MERILDTEFECRKCGKVVSVEQYESDRFCPSCGTLLRLRVRPKLWVLQFNPVIYRWFDRIKENRETEQWLASRYVGELREGDKAVVWAAGTNAGVYAIGEIITNPRKCPLDPEQEKFWTNKEDVYKFRGNYSVTIKYLKVIVDTPILEDECKKDPVLSEMAVLMHPQGTNFPLTKDQWNRILELLDQKHPVTDMLGGPGRINKQNIPHQKS